MKKYACAILLITSIAACNTRKPDAEAVSTDSLNKITRVDSATQIIDAHYFWEADQDSPKGLMMKKSRPISPDSLTTNSLLQVLNNLHPNVELSYVTTSGDTVFVKINKSKYLTQRMGSSGAEAYLAEVTYNLTELTGINFVDINFKMGDHAEPGTYSKTDFVMDKNN